MLQTELTVGCRVVWTDAARRILGWRTAVAWKSKRIGKLLMRMRIILYASKFGSSLLPKSFVYMREYEYKIKANSQTITK